MVALTAINRGERDQFRQGTGEAAGEVHSTLVPDLPKSEDELFVIAPIGAEGSEERKRSDKVLKYIVAPAAERLGLTAAG